MTANVTEQQTLRDKILDAATDVTSEQGWSAVTMARLGELAGVSRQSVYNEVGSKPALADALVMRELSRFLAAVDAELAETPGLRDAIAAAAEAVLVMATDNPLLVAIVSSAHGNNTDLLPLLTTNAQLLISTATTLVSGRIRESHANPALPDRQLATTIEMVVRLVLSHIMAPNGPPSETASEIAWAAARMLDD